jgi:hypothetical protein
MAYGFLATGNNGSFLIDSDTTGTEHLAVVATGTVEAGATLTKQAQDLIFAKPYSTTIGSNRVTYNSVVSATGVTFLKKVYYVQLRKAQSASTTGNYGIQVKNASNTIIYDSRTSTSGLKILGAVPRASLGGAMQPGNGVTTVNNPVLTGTGFPGTGTRSTIIHSGDPTNVYVNASSGYYLMAGGTYPYQYWLEINSAYYDYDNDRILNQGYFYLQSSSSDLFSNSADILKGELIT